MAARMEQLIERLMACGFTRALAKSVIARVMTMRDLEMYVESIEDEYQKNGKLAWLER